MKQKSTLGALVVMVVGAFVAAMFLDREDIQGALFLPLIGLVAIWLFFVILSMARNIRQF